jgi:hypothetical protein
MKSKVRSAALKAGWCSGFEQVIGSQLKALQVAYTYEALSIPFSQPAKARKYTPDFIITANGIIIETKGRFVTADRQKHLLVKEQYPHLDIRFVFSNSRTRISKQSDTTYGKWCEQKGFRYADKTIPTAWLIAPPNFASLNAIAALLQAKNK